MVLLLSTSKRVGSRLRLKSGCGDGVGGIVPLPEAMMDDDVVRGER